MGFPKNNTICVQFHLHPPACISRENNATNDYIIFADVIVYKNKTRTLDTHIISNNI
jgi:hypothetical protein